MTRFSLPERFSMSRDMKLIAVFTTAALLCASTLTVHLATAKGPPVQTVEAHVDVGSDGRLSIQFLGDTMLGDGAQPKLNRNGYDWPFQPGVKAALDGDFVIANSEAAFTHRTKPFIGSKEYFYASDPTAIGALQRVGIDALSLDNNHSMDAGPAGLTDSLTFLADGSMPSFGAGPSLQRAERPLMLRSAAGTVGIVGLGEDFGSSIRAEDAQAGTVVFSPETVQRGVDQARADGADWVIAFVHWGDNYMPINSQQRYWARLMVDAGYDMVIGTGPHVAQKIGFIDGVPIVYSLGNFVFGAPGRFAEYNKSGHGLLVSAELSQTDGISLGVRCLITDNELVQFQPTMCSTKQSSRFLPQINSTMVINGNQGVVGAPHSGSVSGAALDR